MVETFVPKLFFFDIDGTLIDCNRSIMKIPIDVEEALNRLKLQGHRVFLATGRCKCFILDSVMSYPFDGYVTCNGAYVEYNNDVVHRAVIPSEAIVATHELCKKYGWTYYFEGNDYIYVLDKSNAKHIEFQETWGMKEEVVVDDFDPESIETYIGMIVVNEENDIKAMVEGLGDFFDIQRHQSGYSFDLTLKGESKGHGIEELVKVLKMDMKDTVAFGDGRNDIEMLSTVGLGIAMGNAACEAKEVAKYVTNSVDEQGIVNALKYYRFI